MPGQTNDGPRSITRELEIDAPVEAVWKALTDAQELTRWFPLEARVKPGAGGSIWMSWQNEYQFETPIAVWEPNRRLKLIYCEPTPPPKPGEPPSPFVAPYQVAVDYHLEGRGGRTVLRLVHTGFSPDASWDEQYDGTVRGWKASLGGLKHYLERHRGRSRLTAFVRELLPTLTRPEAWSRLMGPRGLVCEGSIDGLTDGRPYRIRTATGDEFRGIVLSYLPPKEFSATIANLNDALLRIHLDDGLLVGRRDVNVQISAYGVAEELVTALRDRLTELVKSLVAV